MDGLIGDIDSILVFDLPFVLSDWYRLDIPFVVLCGSRISVITCAPSNLKLKLIRVDHHRLGYVGGVVYCFDIGDHSILAILIINRLNTACHRAILRQILVVFI